MVDEETRTARNLKRKKGWFARRRIDRCVERDSSNDEPCAVDRNRIKCNKRFRFFFPVDRHAGVEKGVIFHV